MNEPIYIRDGEFPECIHYQDGDGKEHVYKRVLSIQEKYQVATDACKELGKALTKLQEAMEDNP